MQFRPHSIRAAVSGFGPKRIALFLGAFFLFLALFSVFQIAFSPPAERSFDSSSIENREIVVRNPRQKEIFTFAGDLGDKGGGDDTEKNTEKDSAPPETAPKFRSVGVSISPTASETSSLRKKPAPPKVTFSFRPDAVNVDDKLVDLLRANLRAKAFVDKVTPLSVTVDAVRVEPRGQLSGKEVVVSTAMPTDSEKLQVFVHELGHVVDIHYLKPGIFGNDPSEEFYSISWETYKVKKKGAKLTNFVSGYALSNKYEDFAESFSFYVFHNAEFKRRAKTDASLARKYAFFADRIFANAEFSGTNFGSEKYKPYFWDTTKVAVNPKKYLFYIR